MRKRTIFGIVMLLLVLSMSSMSVVKATIYVWDGVHFVEGYEGEWIKYPHPGRVYYGISPYSTQSVDGNMLHHCQVDSATSITLVAAVDVLCAALGAYIGGKIGGLYGAVAGAVVGGALGVVITYVSEVYFLDEYNCIWWWLSLPFMNWVVANAYTLWYYGLANPAYATSLVLSMLYATGYIRVGSVTFADALGIGLPPPFYLTISMGAGDGTTNPAPDTYTYYYVESVTVTASPSTNYEFAYWILDGATKYANPITVTMNSHHDLKAYFEYSGGGGGGGGCPILSVYDITGYVEEGLLDIHNPECTEVVTSRVLTVTPEAVEHRYLMRLTEHPQTHSHIDQVQLYATLKNGTIIKLPLLSAVHSEDGNVKQELLLSDDVRTDTLGADHNNGTSEYIDLEFVAPDGLEIETFTFIIEGYNCFRKPCLEPTP